MKTLEFLFLFTTPPPSTPPTTLAPCVQVGTLAVHFLTTSDNLDDSLKKSPQLAY
jgi:hypothetical protein